MYQTDQPMIPYMYNDLKKLLRKLVKLKDINIGFAASSRLKELKRKDLISNGQIASFFNDVMLFICCTVQKWLEKSPIFYNIICNSLVFDPQVVVNKNILHVQCKLKKLLEHLIKLKIPDSFCCDNVLVQFVEFVTHDVKLNIDKFKSFERYKTKLDVFYFQTIELDKYKGLKYVMKFILTLSHGQASVERGFSINKSVEKVNVTEESIVSKKLVRDHMIENELEPHTVPISNQLIRSVSCAHQSYKESLLAAKKAKENNRISNEKRVLLEEINAVSSKFVDLQNKSKTLDGEFIVCVKNAGKKNVMNLVIKGNALKRRSEEAQTELKLREALGILEEKGKK